MNDLIVACTKGNVDVVRKLVTEKSLDPSQKDPVTGMSPFHYASQHGHVDILAFFIECKCDTMTGTKDKNTALHLACANGQVDAGLYLIEHLAQAHLRRRNREGNTPLHMACMGGSDRLVHALLESLPEALQAVNAKGTTPFGYAMRYSHLEIAKLLIARTTHGTLLSTAEFTALFPDFERHSDNISTILDDPLKFFVVGDHQTGKSSFIRSLQAETWWDKIKGISRVTPGIDEHTVGVVPNDFVSQSLGTRLIFYDLASGTNCIHEDLLQSDNEVECCLFVIVIDTSDSRKGMETKILYWLNFISLQCVKFRRSTPNVVIVGSHADTYKPFTLANSNRLHIAYNNVLSANKELKVRFNLLRKYSVDCRKANSLAFPYLRTALKKFCDRIGLSFKSGKDLPDRCYILNAILLDVLAETSFPGIQMSELAAKISEKAAVHKVTLASLLPPAVGDLLHFCAILQDCGHILLLKPSSVSTSAESTWVVQPSHHLLTKIDKALTRIADQTTPSPAFLTFELLARYLPFVPEDLLLPLLKHFKVYDGTEVTVKSRASKTEAEQSYLYIPALLPRECKLQPWNPSDDAHSLTFAWSFIPLAGQEQQFFSPRFLKLLLLSLFKNFSESEDFSAPSVWSGGICSHSSGEIEVCVVTDRKYITLNMRCQPSHEVPCLQHRNQILTEIRAQRESLQPVMKVEEYLIPSKVAQFPVTRVDSTKHLSSIGLLKQVITQGSQPGAKIELPSSFLEPCIFLTKISEAHQYQLVDPDNASKAVSDEFRHDLAEQLKDDWPHVTRHLFQQSFEGDTSTRSSQSTDSEPYQTFSELLGNLSSFSVFETELTNAIQVSSAFSSTHSAKPEIEPTCLNHILR